MHASRAADRCWCPHMHASRAADRCWCPYMHASPRRGSPRAAAAPGRRHDAAGSAHCPQPRPALTDTAAILTTVIQVEPVLEIDPDAPRALIADDRELNYELVRDVLESLGWQATWARDGREALEMLLAESFDLLLLDLHMP